MKSQSGHCLGLVKHKLNKFKMLLRNKRDKE